jgi:hypothetical protein
MVSISEMSGNSGTNSDDEDEKSDSPKPRPHPPMKLESIMSNASFICSAEFDSILDDSSAPKTGVKKRVSFRNDDKLASIKDDDFSEAVIVLSSSDPFEFSISDNLTEKEDVTPPAHATQSDKSFISKNSTVPKSPAKENSTVSKKVDSVAPAVSTGSATKPVEDDSNSSKPPVACCVIS